MIKDTIENGVIQIVMKPLHIFNSFMPSVSLILVMAGLGVLGYFTYHNDQTNKTMAHQIELTNKYYVLQNQDQILLKVIDENLRESDKAKPGSAPMELKIQTAKMMKDMSQLKNVDLSILCGIAQTESGWNTHAISSSGCVGLMQVTPMYARVYLREKGINYKPDIWFDPVISIMCGVSMLCDAQEEHIEKGRTKPGDYLVSLHSYFWGASNTQILFSQKDARSNVPNMAYPMRVMEAAKRYKDLGL